MIEQITVNPINESLFSAEFLKGFRCGVKRQFQADVEEIAKAKNRPKNMIHIDDVYRLIAGHSNYHGDSILSAFTCLIEGKDVKPIAPLDESADIEEDVARRIATIIENEQDMRVILKNAEPKTGKWIFDEDGYFHCEMCGKKPNDQNATTDYCPYCGSKIERRKP